MIELSILKGQYGNLQTVDIPVGDGWIKTQCLPEVAIQVVVENRSILTTTLAHEQIHRLVGQKPNAYIHQEQVCLHQFS